MTSDNESKIRIKVTLGYVLVAVFAAFAVWYIYKRIVPLAAPQDTTQGVAYRRVLVTGTTISSLYEASYRANVYLQSPSPGNMREYDRAVDTVFAHIDSLHRLRIPAEQVDILDEITELLKWKKQNLAALATMLQTRQARQVRQVLRQDSLIRALERKDTLSPLVVYIDRQLRKDTSFTISPLRKRTPRSRTGGTPTADQRDSLKSPVVPAPLRADTVSLPLLSDTTGRPVKPGKVRTAVASKAAGRDREAESIRRKHHALMLVDQTINDRAILLLHKMNDENIQAALNEIQGREHTLQQAGRSMLWIVVAALCIMFLFVALIFSDINKSERYKLALEEARRKAEDLMESRQRLLLSISHDIRAPLSSIMGYVELLSADPTPGKIAGYAANMRYSSNHLMELLTNLLEYSRIETGKMTLDPVPFRAAPLFRETVGMFVPASQKKGLALTFRDDLPADACLKADAARIRQILINLLSNAVKFTDRGSVTLSVGLELADGAGEAVLRFDVRDTGCGIAPDEQERVFDEFSRADTAGKEGSGFGLAVVSRLTEMMGGHLSLESRPGEGSDFCVSIPVQIVSGSEIPLPEPEVPAPAVSRSILVVEDDPSQRAVLGEILRSAGHEVGFCDRLEQCLDCLAGSGADLVLTDIQLGGFSGYQLLDTVRSASAAWIRRLPVVAVSASVRLKDDGAQFDGVLRKPFTKRELMETIARLPLPEPGFDLQMLRELMGDDGQAIRSVVETFVASTRENLGLLAEYSSGGDCAAVARLAHRMLPMFRQLHADRIAADLETLESLGPGGDPESVAELVRRLTANTLRMLDRLAASL